MRLFGQHASGGLPAQWRLKINGFAILTRRAARRTITVTGHLRRISRLPVAGGTSAVKTAVTRAYGRMAAPPLVHIAPVEGTFYYGKCGEMFYAAARFEPTAGATTAEQVALQDEGAAMKYFTGTNSRWRYAASDIVPHSQAIARGGCASIHQIPAALSRLWDGCRAGELAGY